MEHQSEILNHDTEASATVYRSKQGPTAIMKHIHYAYRGAELADFSLFEYAALVQIVQKLTTKGKKATDAEPETCNFDEREIEPQPGCSFHDSIVEPTRSPPLKKIGKQVDVHQTELSISYPIIPCMKRTCNV